MVSVKSAKLYMKQRSNQQTEIRKEGEEITIKCRIIRNTKLDLSKFVLNEHTTYKYLITRMVQCQISARQMQHKNVEQWLKNGF